MVMEIKFLVKIFYRDADGNIFANGNGNGGNQKQWWDQQKVLFKYQKCNQDYQITKKNGNIITAMLAWRGGNYSLQMFFPTVKKPSRREVQDQVRKVYPGAKLWNYQVSNYDPGEPLLQTGGD